MVDSEIPGTTTTKTDRSPWLRTVLWMLVGIALILGLVLFFRYTRHVTPML